MNILALETSTEYCSVALLHSGGLAARSELAGQRHSELVLPMVDAVLAEGGLTLTDLAAIGFGAGPGSFTGLRIACGVAQGLALGANVPVVPVGTLLALASETGGERVLACLDARMGEIYHAAYVKSDDQWRESVAPNVCRAEQAPPVEGEGWIGAGSAFQAYGPMLSERYRGQLTRTLPDTWPQATAVARLARELLRKGGGLPAEKAAPLYVRDRVALKMHERP